MIRRLFPAGFPAAEPAPRGSWRPALLAAACLAAAVIVLYWPAVDFRLLSFDDYYYTQNDVIAGGLNGANIVRIFTELPEEDLFTPVTQLSFMADVELFGTAPRGLHLTGIVLHAVDMGLLLLVLWRMTGALGKSSAAAALAALHPLRVESVAWVTERKDVVAVLFLVLSIACHVRYARTEKRRWYVALVACGALGMLAKPILVTLPLLLLLLDFWPLGRFREERDDGTPAFSWRKPLALAAEKLPMAALSLLACLATLHLQQERALHDGISLASRLEHSLSSVFIYLYQTAWPVDLVFRYFDTPWNRFSGTLIPVAAGFAIVTAIVLRFAGRRPFLAVGWGWYLVALFPVSGIVPTGTQWISDRFTYIPHVGLAVALVWFAGGVPFRRWRSALPALAVIVIALLALLSRRQLGFWKDGATLFGRGMACNGQDLRYANQYIEELVHAGDLSRAREQFERLRGSALDPWFGAPLQITHLSLLEKAGGRDDAIAQARRYLAADPRFFKTRLRLADHLLAVGRPGEAAAEYREVLEVRGLTLRQRRHAAEELGFALYLMGMDDEALLCYRAVLVGNPVRASIHWKLGLLLARRGRSEEALAHFARSLEIDPRGIRPRLGMAEIFLGAGQVNEAVRQLEDVARSAPERAEGLYARGRILEAGGMSGQARSRYERALAMPAAFPDTIDEIRARVGRLP